MKMLGNEIADEEAKMAEAGAEEREFEIESKITIRNAEGYRVTEQGVR